MQDGLPMSKQRYNGAYAAVLGLDSSSSVGASNKTKRRSAASTSTTAPTPDALAERLHRLESMIAQNSETELRNQQLHQQQPQQQHLQPAEHSTAAADA